jgi:hypothetical protein
MWRCVRAWAPRRRRTTERSVWVSGDEQRAESLKNALRDKYSLAKQLGESVNAARAKCVLPPSVAGRSARTVPHRVTRHVLMLAASTPSRARSSGVALNVACKLCFRMAAAVSCRAHESAGSTVGSHSASGTAPAGEAVDPAEEQLRGRMEEEKRAYQTDFARLKTLKGEIEQQQHLVQNMSVKLRQEFEVTRYSAFEHPPANLAAAAALS